MDQKTKTGRRAADGGNEPVSALRHCGAFRIGRLTAAAAIALTAATPAYANPKGGQVSAGSAAITHRGRS